MNDNSIKVLFVEARGVDAEGIGAIMGIVREAQGGSVQPQLVTVTAAAPELAAAVDDAPALPAKVRKPRAVAAPVEKLERGAGGRTKGAADAIVAAFKSTTTPDRNAMARSIYGDTSDASLKRINRMIWSLANKGRLKAIGEGAYKVVG